jgi:multiple sugar transport system substrate-binding protein
MQKFTRLATGGALVFAIVASLAACAPAAPAADAEGPLVIWVDAAREAQAQAYADQEGAENFNIIIVDATDLSTKLAQAKDDPSTRPDVVLSQGDTVSLDAKYSIAQDLTSLVDAKVQSDLTLSACQTNGRLVCLPNDVATTMLWYDPVKMAEFGYTVPKTFDEYAALGERVAAEHPGYIIGSCADWACPNLFFRANGCDGVDSNDGTTGVVYLASDPKCKEVATALDPLIANGSIATLGPFDADFATLVKDEKVLMLPGFVWFPGALYKGNIPDGALAAAPFPTWSDGKSGQAAGTGAQWIVMNSSQRQKAAVKFVVDQVTNIDRLASILTFPAYVPAQSAWSAVQAKDPIFGEDPTATFVSAGKDLEGVNLTTVPGFDLLGTFSNVVGPALKSGGNITDNLGAWQDALVQSGTDFGLAVTVKK